MIGTCPHCGNYKKDKTVTDTEILCPRCGYRWHYRRLPLFILSGCSGVGKTTTGQALLQRQTDFIVLDGDIFYNIMPHESDADYLDQVEQMESLSRNLMQSGKPVLWTMAGCLDKLRQTYNCRFFSEIYCLALTCEESALRRRMTEGRGITDEDWLRSSAEYNRYFQTHDRLGDLPFETLDITQKSVMAVADDVEAWVKRHLTVSKSHQ
ncbi:MAG: AAA family ATPase [Eubacteriales bacterium]